MRVMVIVKATEDSEAGVMPSEELLDGDGQVQRGAGQGRRHAGRRRAAPQLEGRARAVRRRPAARSSTGPSPRPRSWSPASGSGRSARWRRPSSGSKRCPFRPASRGRGPAGLRAPRTSARRSPPSCASRRTRLRADVGSQAAGLTVRRGGGDVRTTAPASIEAVWRMESARLIAGLARVVGDVGLAEELAQDALSPRWSSGRESGVPDKPGRLADGHRQAPRHRPVRRDSAMLERKHDRARPRAASARRRARLGPRPLDEDVERRPAAAGVHRLPPGALHARRGWR